MAFYSVAGGEGWLAACKNPGPCSRFFLFSLLTPQLFFGTVQTLRQRVRNSGIGEYSLVVRGLLRMGVASSY